MKSMDYKLIDNSRQVLDATDRAIEAGLQAVGIAVEADAKMELENSPRRIDTGLLRNSITFAVSGKSPNITSYRGDRESKYGIRKGIPSGSYSGTAPADGDGKKAVYIGSNVEYAEYIHEGADMELFGDSEKKKRLEPNRFLKNAVEKNRDRIKAIFINELNKTGV